MKILVPLVGIHSAGKSTIRRELEKSGYITEEECAEILRVNNHLIAGAGAEKSFEELVRSEEMKRDGNRIWKSNMIFVESWHILTMAYMLTRGIPETQIEEYFDYVSTQMQNHVIYCIFLKSNPYKILERSTKLHTEKDIGLYYEFYKNLEQNIKIVLDRLGLEYKEFDTMKPLKTTMFEITSYIKTFKAGDLYEKI